MASTSRKTKLLCKPLPNEVRHALRSGVVISTVVRCVEELVLNSIDAAATIISVSVNLSTFKVRVEDNGNGLTKEDLEVVGNRYYTSKISSLNDLLNVKTFGLRGEALASIIEFASVVEIITKSVVNANDASYSKKFKNGKAGEVLQISEKKRKPQGLIILVQNLLAKAPVRQKRIDKVIEFEELKSCLEYISLMNPRVSLSLRNDETGAKLFSTTALHSTSECFKQRFGNKLGPHLHQNLLEINCSVNVFYLNGFVSRDAHSSKSHQFLYVNKRIVMKSKVHKMIHQLLCPALGLTSRHYSSSSNQSLQEKERSKKSPQPNPSEKYPVYVINISCPANEYDMSFDTNKNIVEFRNIEMLQTALENFVHYVKVSVQNQSKRVVETKSLQQTKGYSSFMKVRGVDQHPLASTIDKLQGTSKEVVRKVFGDDVTTHDLKGALHSVPAVRERKDSRLSCEEPTKKQRRGSYDQRMKSSPSSEELFQHRQESSSLSQPVGKRLSRKPPERRSSPKTHTLDIRALKRRQQSAEAVSGQGAASKHSGVVAPKRPRVLGPVFEKFPVWQSEVNSTVSAAANYTPGNIGKCEDSDDESQVSNQLSRMSVTTESACNFGDVAETKSVKSNLIHSAEMFLTPASLNTPCSGTSFIKVDKSLNTHRVAIASCVETVKKNRNFPDIKKNVKSGILEFIHSCSDKSILHSLQREIHNFSNRGSHSAPNYLTPVQQKRPGHYTPNYVNIDLGKATANIPQNQNVKGNHSRENPFSTSLINNKPSNSNSFSAIRQSSDARVGLGAGIMLGNTAYGSSCKSSLPTNRVFGNELSRSIPNADASSSEHRAENTSVLLRSKRKDGSKTSNQSEKRHGMYISSQEFPSGFGAIEQQYPFVSTAEETRTGNKLSSTQTVQEKPVGDRDFRSEGHGTDFRVMKWVESSSNVVPINPFSPADGEDVDGRNSTFCGTEGYNRNPAAGEHHFRQIQQPRQTCTFRDSSSSEEMQTQIPISFSQQYNNANLAEYERQPLDLPNEFIVDSQNAIGQSDYFLPEYESTGDFQRSHHFERSIGFPYNEIETNHSIPIPDAFTPTLTAPGERGGYLTLSNFFTDQNQDPCENMRRNSLSSEYFCNPDDESKMKFSTLDEMTKTPKAINDIFHSLHSTSTEASPYVFQPVEPADFLPVFSPAPELPLREKAQNANGENMKSFEIRTTSNPDSITVGNSHADRNNIESSTAEDPLNLNSVLYSKICTSRSSFRSSWLRRFFPESASKFWKPEEGKDKIQPIGDIDLINSGNTIIGDVIHSCFAETEAELFLNKWRDSSGTLESQSLRPSRLKNWDGPQVCSTEVPVVNLRASEMQIWHKKIDIAQGSSSCRFTKEDLARTVVVGNIDRKFIAAKITVTQRNEPDGESQILVLFDQHAVHERIRLEQLLNDVYVGAAPSEKVVASVEIHPPIEMNFSDTEVRVMAAYMKEFTLLGVALEITGSNTVKLMTSPKCFMEKALKETIAARHETLQKLLRSLLQEKVKHIMDMKGAVQQLPKTILNVLKSQACSGAIKFGDELSMEASIDLINDLKKCKAPFQCAHGRPVLAPLLDLK